MFSRLLVPLDGSQLAEAVLPVVERIALACNATLVLFHLIERGAPATIHGERHFTDEAAATKYLMALIETLHGRGVAATVHVHAVPEGNVAASIAEHGEEERADLIALCTHGSGGLRGLLVGSIAQQVLQRGTIPVLLVRPPIEGPPPVFDPHTILVPLDGTPAAAEALAPAAALAGKLGVRLHLTMVVATQGTLRGERSAVATLLPTATRAVLDAEGDQAEAYLREQAERLRAAGLTVDTEVRRGAPTSQLADETAEHPIGLVVAATHGRAGLAAMWAGSVAARLLTRTTAPVLLLRRLDRD